MNEVEQISDRIRTALPDVKKGTLRFWGVWFGRPHDNYHILAGCDTEGEVLRLHFDQGEVLSVWCPRKLTVKKSKFRISRADRVRWEWFFYGLPRDPSNLYFMDFVKSWTAIVATTNFQTQLDNGRAPVLKPRRWSAAVEIL
jgi:hypothetical protein